MGNTESDVGRRVGAGARHGRLGVAREVLAAAWGALRSNLVLVLRRAGRGIVHARPSLGGIINV